MCTITLSCRSSIFSGKIHYLSFRLRLRIFRFLFLIFLLFLLLYSFDTRLNSTSKSLKKKHFLNPLFERFLGNILEGRAGGGRKGNLPAQVPNLILPTCGSARPQRTSEPPLNSLPEMIFIYNRQFLLKM